MRIGSEMIDLRLSMIESAQCFRCTELEGALGTVIDGMPVWFCADSQGVYAEITDQADAHTLAALRRYLDLDRDYSEIAVRYADMPIAKQVLALYPGLRILNQSPWDALLSFILSANNNVSRIQTLSDRMASRLGAAYETPRGVLYAYPSPERLAACDEAELRALGVGYRAPYLIQTARAVAEGFPLDALKDLPYEEAHAALTTLAGVGDKVADCVLLFGCGHASAFPVDVWIERLLAGWFGIRAKSRKKLMLAARERFGEYAGLLQQFLFHAARTGAMNLN